MHISQCSEADVRASVMRAALRLFNSCEPRGADYDNGILSNLPKHSRLHVAMPDWRHKLRKRREIRRSMPLAMAALPLAARQVRGATHTSREGSVSGGSARSRSQPLYHEFGAAAAHRPDGQSRRTVGPSQSGWDRNSRPVRSRRSPQQRYHAARGGQRPEAPPQFLPSLGYCLQRRQLAEQEIRACGPPLREPMRLRRGL